MKKQNLSWLVVPALALTASLVHASTAGLQTDPVGSRAGSVGYAVFDLFADADPGAALSFTNLSPASSGGASYITATTSAAMAGGLVTGSGERIYNGVGPNSAAFNLSINASAFSTINTAAVQIKYTLGDAAVVSLATYKNFFTVTLNGVAATPTEVLVPVAASGLGSTGGQYFGVVKWTWTDLNLSSGNSLSVGITSAANGHVSVDSYSLDATPVPEPHEYALAMGALLVAVIVMRRRRMTAAQ